MKVKILSKFNEKPKTKTAWLAMWLGIFTFFVPSFLGISAAVIVPLIRRISSDTIASSIGLSFAVLALGITFVALVAGIRAYRFGERSWVLWIGFIPAILISCFWVFMIIGEFIFPH